MRDSTTTRTILLIDEGAGVILEAPPEVEVSERYVDSNPFIERTRTHVIAGPDAKKVASGSGGVDYVLYEIKGRYFGSLQLKREG